MNLESDILSVAALANAYATCHNVQDLLYFRGFSSKPAHAKRNKKSGKSRKKKGVRWNATKKYHMMIHTIYLFLNNILYPCSFLNVTIGYCTNRSSCFLLCMCHGYHLSILSKIIWLNINLWTIKMCYIVVSLNEILCFLYCVSGRDEWLKINQITLLENS